MYFQILKNNFLVLKIETYLYKLELENQFSNFKNRKLSVD